MIAALIFILIIMMMIAAVARLIWIDARRVSRRREAIEHDVDEQIGTFRRVGGHAADVVAKIDRRRA